MTMDEVIYKYMSADIAQKVLANNCLRATPPNDFNDPFEMLPRQYVGLTADITYEMARTKSRSLAYYEKVRAIPRYSKMNYDEYLAYLDAHPDIERDVATNMKKSFENRDFATLVNQVSSILGVLCFSGKRDTILMWSHYADDHKGVVIGFDPVKLSPSWFPAQYHDERVNLPFGEDALSPIYKQAVIDILSTKHSSWIYENEYRFFVKLDKCTKQNIKGKDMYFHALPDGCIKEVVLGAKISEPEKNVIKGLCSCNVLEAKIDQRDFKLVI